MMIDVLIDSLGNIIGLILIPYFISSYLIQKTKLKSYIIIGFYILYSTIISIPLMRLIRHPTIVEIVSSEFTKRIYFSLTFILILQLIIYRLTKKNKD
jgi:hypothetical protein